MINAESRWTKPEIDFLITHYKDKGSEWCSKKLGRGRRGVICKASQIQCKGYRGFRSEQWKIDRGLI